jgi:hypothetical protein
MQFLVFGEVGKTAQMVFSKNSQFFIAAAAVYGNFSVSDNCIDNIFLLK